MFPASYSSRMELSKSSKRRLRCLFSSNSYRCFRYSSSDYNLQSSLTSNPKTLVSPKPFPIPISSSDHFKLKPASHMSKSFIFSYGSSSFCQLTHSPHTLSFNACNGYRSQGPKLGSFTSRCISFCTRVNEQYANQQHVLKIIELIRSGDGETESKLASMNASLSSDSAFQIFQVLNSEKVSALCLFNYLRDMMPEVCKNPDICSLVINNCGRLDDYDTMHQLLTEFSKNQLCINEKAFGFLPVMMSKRLTKMCILRVVEVLNKVGGCCRSSGVLALIEMLSVLGSFEMSKYVIKMTERKVSYYNLLIREMCRKRDYKGPRDLLDEMRAAGCEPNTQSYNYMLGGLCKNGKDAEAHELFEEMLGRNCPVDALTYEIFVCHSCRFGKFDIALKFLDQMVERGLEPRPSTHAAFIKGYFRFHRYEEAYKYVILLADKHASCSNMMFCLLASLHDKNKNPVMAKNVLVKMIEIGLRPNVSVYRKVLKHLHTSRHEDVAKCLSNRYSSLSSG